MSLYTKTIDIQKLNEAWKKVKSNKPAAGVDNVSYEDFDCGLRENIKQLNLELKESRYEPLPVKLVDLYKGEKVRTISLFSMRDKVVQQSLALELSKIYESEFSDSTYAYRPGRAALQAIDFLEKEIVKREVSWVLKVDINNFFDSINHNQLYNILKRKIRDQDMLELIKKSYEVREL